MTDSTMLKAAGNSELLTFTGSDFASCEETRKSRCEACIFFCKSLIYWKSGKQNHVSRSTTEAEFYALLEGITEVEFLSILPTKLTKESSIAKILQFSVIIRVRERLPAQSNPSHEQSTLKLLISGFNKKFAKERIIAHYESTENQATDIFTTSLARPLLEKFKKRLGLISSKKM